jgi:hypothetical protein
MLNQTIKLGEPVLRPVFSASQWSIANPMMIKLAGLIAGQGMGNIPLEPKEMPECLEQDDATTEGATQTDIKNKS